MDFSLLGPLEVSDGGRAVALGGSKQRALLALLVLHANEALSTDRERLEHEREGGGAPSERIGVGHRSMVGRLLDLLVGRKR